MAMISKVEPNSYSHARQAVKKGEPVMFEFCCSDESTLGKVHEERGITHFRLSETTSDLSDPEEIDSLKNLLSLFPGCNLWGSLPCGPWSTVSQFGKTWGSIQKEVGKETCSIKETPQAFY
jgi:hypothetical protein